jgi:hypothetical protein
MVYLERFVYLFNFTEVACLEVTDPISTFKHLSSRQYSFQNQNQFSQGNKMLDVANSNIDGFLWRDSCVLQFSLIGLLGANTAHVQLETPKLQEVFLSKS